MNENQAETIAAELADHYASEQEQSRVEQVFGRVHRAVFRQALEIPGDPVTAIIQRTGDNAFMLVAVDGQQLYLLTVDEAEDEMGLPRTECRMLHIQPGAGSVSQKAKYFDRKGRTAARSTTWTFRFVDGTTLVVETHFDPDEGRKNDREAVARALASALGWKLPRLEQDKPEPLVAWR